MSKFLRLSLKNRSLASGRKKLVVGVIAAVIFSAGIFWFFQSTRIGATTFTWLQETWSGGADTVNFPRHGANETGWTKYYSKDTQIDTSNNELKIAGTSGNWAETSDADFNAGDKTDYIYVGSNTAYPQKPNAYACETNNDNLCQSGRCDTTCQAKLADGQSCDEASDCINSCNGSTCYTPPCGGVTSITDDRDTNNPIYNTVEIGIQCWLKRNENVGTIIAGASSQTNNAILEKYCYSDTEANCTADGGLYQWNEAMQYVTTEGAQGICPIGWHIPRDSEQYTLENYLKITGQTCVSTRTAWDCNDAGTDMKSSGSPYFYAPLAGYRYPDGTFYYRTSYALLWSSTQYGAPHAWYRDLHSPNATVNRYYHSKANGFSVRCLKN